MRTTPGHRDARTDTRATQPHEHQRCVNTPSGSGAGACTNGLEDEFEERCGGQSRLMDGGRHADLALKDAGPRAVDGVTESGPIESR